MAIVGGGPRNDRSYEILVLRVDVAERRVQSQALHRHPSDFEFGAASFRGGRIADDLLKERRDRQRFEHILLQVMIRAVVGRRVYAQTLLEKISLHPDLK